MSKSFYIVLFYVEPYCFSLFIEKNEHEDNNPVLLGVRMEKKPGIDISGTGRTIESLKQKIKQAKSISIFDFTKIESLSSFNNKKKNKTLTLLENFSIEIKKQYKENSGDNSLESLGLASKNNLVIQFIYEFFTKKHVENENLINLVQKNILKDQEISETIKKKWTNFEFNKFNIIEKLKEEKLEEEEEEIPESKFLNMEEMLDICSEILKILKNNSVMDERWYVNQFTNKVQRLIFYAKANKKLDRTSFLWLYEYLAEFELFINYQEYITKKNSMSKVDFKTFLIFLNDAGTHLQRNEDIKKAQLRIVYSLAFIFSLEIRELETYTEPKINSLIENKKIAFNFQNLKNDVNEISYEISSPEKISLLNNVSKDVKYFFRKTGAINLRNDSVTSKSTPSQLHNNFYVFVNKDIKKTVVKHGLNNNYSVKSFGKINFLNSILD